MENFSTKIKQLTNELVDTINKGVEELKTMVVDNVSMLNQVKANLVYAHTELNELSGIADDMSFAMEQVAEDTCNAVDELECVLAELIPEDFGDSWNEECEEDCEEECIVVEDLETGEETEYPIN